MRPRRQILQVSTFPFLAVLLCAMGSLILLLLVIDRRAKTVARFKALQAITKTSEADREAAAARRIEWERRKEKLHAELLKQDDAIQIQLRDIRDKSRSSVLEIEAKQKEVTAVRTRVDNANRELATKREHMLDR